MKKEIKTSISLQNEEKLVNQLVEAGYAFAAWRMPSKQQINLIIALSIPTQKQQSLVDLDKGFIINSYDDNHPAKPFHIPADIQVVDESLQIDPRINDSEFEAFIKKIEDSKLDKAQVKPTVSESLSSPFEQVVTKAIDEIAKGRFEKVVLSRYQDMALNSSFGAWSFFEKICNAYPGAFCSLSHIPGKGIWVGASPELLISTDKNRFKTIALAGTKPLDESQNLREVAWTHKEIEEQAFVSRYIINCFKKLRLREFHEHGPKTVRSGSLVHLKTEFEVKYDEVYFESLADQMLELLHPTSAVCGMPIDEAKPWIHEVEGYDRAFYAGFLGPVNFNDSTDLFVNLRCMRVQDDTARMYAGAGITEDSDPVKEMEETEMKMQVMKRFL